MGNSLDNAMKIMDANDPDDPYSGSRYSDEELEQAVNQLHETPVVQATIKAGEVVKDGVVHCAENAGGGLVGGAYGALYGLAIGGPGGAAVYGAIGATAGLIGGAEAALNVINAGETGPDLHKPNFDV